MVKSKRRLNATGKVQLIAVIGLVAAFSVAGQLVKSSQNNQVLADSNKIVSLYVDGEKKIFTTEATKVREAVTRAGIILHEGDIVEPALDAEITDGFFNINVYRSELYRIHDAGVTTVVRTAERTPVLIAARAGLTIYPEDKVELAPVRDLVGAQVVGLDINVERATAVNVLVDGQAKVLRTHLATIREMLAEHQISLGLQDVVEPGLDAPVVPGETVTVARISQVVVTQDEVLPFNVKTIYEPNMLKGLTEVRAQGVDGRQKATYRIHYRNGTETGRQTLNIEGRVEPVERVVVVGTKQFFTGSVEQWRSLVAKYFPPEEVDNALLVIKRESGGNPFAVSKTDDHGLMQLHKEPIYDPEANIARGYQKWIRAGSWRPWYAVCPAGGGSPYGLKCR